MLRLIITIVIIIIIIIDFYSACLKKNINAGHKFTTQKQKCGHVNTKNLNSYLNISCIKLVTQV